MCILKVEPGKKPYEKDISKDLDSIQAEVGDGFFQVVDLGGIFLYCNEEGKLNGMAPNRRLGNDIICGPFFLREMTASAIPSLSLTSRWQNTGSDSWSRRSLPAGSRS